MFKNLKDMFRGVSEWLVKPSEPPLPSDHPFSLVDRAMRAHDYDALVGAANDLAHLLPLNNMVPGENGRVNFPRMLVGIAEFLAKKPAYVPAAIAIAKNVIAYGPPNYIYKTMSAQFILDCADRMPAGGQRTELAKYAAEQLKDDRYMKRALNMMLDDADVEPDARTRLGIAWFAVTHTVVSRQVDRACTMLLNDVHDAVGGLPEKQIILDLVWERHERYSSYRYYAQTERQRMWDQYSPTKVSRQFNKSHDL